ncbi:MAG TPA: CoB--CoM heterodisulfide reductase iron-sulfur subunit B family protein [Candidatus Deferrimicrobium sp.]|nr:CoB--CoM heterodisulfide reductase iron-sulfur subunit B family protein [Candidatus Deferrimicrobium sp.]
MKITLEQLQKEKLELIPESGEIFLFKSCTINSLYPSVEASTRKCLKHLEFKIIESNEQTCCTDPLYYSNLATDLQMTAVMARNFSIIGKYTKNIVTECNGCFSTLVQAIENLKNHEIRQKVEPILAKIGYKLENNFNIFHIAELYYKILPKILALRKIDLSGIRIATHYGCNYLRAHPKYIITDSQMPNILESIIQKCDGTPAYYTENDCCCGAGIIQRNIDPDLSLEVSYQKMKSMVESEPELIVTICPFCMSTLENCQFHLQVEKDFELSIPVLHVSELIAVILGFDPLTELALDSHSLNPLPIFKKFKVI